MPEIEKNTQSPALKDPQFDLHIKEHENDYSLYMSSEGGFIAGITTDSREFAKEEILKNKKPIWDCARVKGIYFLIYNEIIVYIGISNNIFDRIVKHINKKEIIFTHYYFIRLTISWTLLERIEAQCIFNYKPIYNKQLRYPINCHHFKSRDYKKRCLDAQIELLSQMKMYKNEEYDAIQDKISELLENKNKKQRKYNKEIIPQYEEKRKITANQWLTRIKKENKKIIGNKRKNNDRN